METASIDYWGFVFAAYSVAAVVVVAMLIFSLRELQRAQKTLKNLQKNEA